MKLLTDEIRERLPALYATDGEKDPVVQARYFATWFNWTWYAIEFDGEDTFYGLVYGHCSELGYFSLAELSSGVRKRHQVERDCHFKPTRLSEIRELHEKSRAG